MHFISADQCSSLPVTNSLYIASHKTGTRGKNDENGLYSQCVFSASTNVIDTQIQTYHLAVTQYVVSEVMGVTCISEMLPQMSSTRKFLHLKTIAF